MLRYWLLAVIVSAPAFGATYKCKDAKGNWTEAACTGAAAPPVEPPAVGRNIAAENALYERYRTYCKDLGYSTYSSETSCAYEHMQGIRYVLKVQDEFAEGTPQRDKINACVARWYIRTVDLFDGRMLKHCYLRP